MEEIKSNGIMKEGEGLEDRQDIDGFFLLSILSDDPGLFASLLAEQSLVR